MRGKLYELLVSCVPPEQVMRTLSEELLKKLDDDMKHDVRAPLLRVWPTWSPAWRGWVLTRALQVVEWAAYFEHRMQEGSKAIFHLEGFVTRIMSVYKQWAQAAFGQ